MTIGSEASFTTSSPVNTVPGEAPHTHVGNDLVQSPLLSHVLTRFPVPWVYGNLHVYVTVPPLSSVVTV